MPTFDLFLDIWNQTQNMQTPEVHSHIARWLMQGIRRRPTRLALMAFRGCGKSSLTALYCAWLLCQDPELRILVIAAEEGLAIRMVRNVRAILEQHPLCQHLIPDNKAAGGALWRSDCLTVARKNVSRDPSLRAAGLRGNITGTRADMIICDDVEVPNTCDTHVKRAALRDVLRELDFILAPPDPYRIGGILYLGTPHHTDTIYTADHGGFLQDYAILRVPISRDGVPAWPQRFGADVIAALRDRVGPRLFEAQMMLAAQTLSEARLNPQDVQSYAGSLQYRQSGGRDFCDLHLDNANATVYAVTPIAWWDPALGQSEHSSRANRDQSVLAIVLGTRDGGAYVHELAAVDQEQDPETDAATAQVLTVLSVLRRLNLTHLWVEQNGLGRFLPDLARRIARERGQTLHLRAVHTRRNKTEKILSAFDPMLSGRRLWVREDIWHKRELENQMQDWRPDRPDVGHDDMLDAIASALHKLPQKGLGSHVLPKGIETILDH